MEQNKNIDFAKIASDDFEKIKNAKITWIEVNEKLKQPDYRAHYIKLLENEAEKMNMNKDVHVSMTLSSLEQSSRQVKSTLSPNELINIYEDINKRNPEFGIGVPDDIYYKNIAQQDFEKLKNSKITWLEVGEKLNNPHYKESYIELLEKEADKYNYNREDHVKSSIELIEVATYQAKQRTNKNNLRELYNDIISRNPDFEIKIPEDIMSEKDKINNQLESIEKNNSTYTEAKEDFEKHLNNKISDIEIAEKLNSNLEYKMAFTRYLEKDFHDKKRIGVDAKSYAEERITSINLSLLYKGKKLNDQEGFYAEEKSDKISDDWIKRKNIDNENNSNSTLDILKKMKATPNNNGDVAYSIGDNPAFTDKGQSIQFSSSKPSDEEILAAVLLAREKYHNSFALTGPKDYQERVMKIMLDNNINVNFLDKNQAKKFAEMQAETTNKFSPNPNVGFSGDAKHPDQPLSDLNTVDRGEVNMDQNNTDKEKVSQDAPKKILAVKGVVRNDDGSFTQNVLLWKDPNEKGLSGKIITPDGVTHQVKADIVARNDGKSNFLAIKVKSPQGDGNTPYVDWGYANAVNSRKDNKEVYFDEIIFNLQKLKQYDNLILKARVGEKVSDELHKELGFNDKKQTRPKFENKAENNLEAPTPAADSSPDTPKKSRKARNTA